MPRREVERLAQARVAVFESRTRPLTELPDWRSRGTSPAKAAACRALRYCLMSGNSAKGAAVVSLMPGIVSSNSRWR